MATITKPRQRVKPPRTVRVLRPATPTNNICAIRITEGRKVSDYLIAPIPSDWGMAFQVEKQLPERETYHVLLERDGCSCSCKGFERWGHCRHISVVPVLLERGALQSSWPQGYAAWSAGVSEGRE